MEQVEARVSRSWAVRMTIAGLAFAGFGLASLYDGKIRYPEVNRDYRSYLAQYIGVETSELRKYYQPTEERELAKFAGFSQRWNEHWKSTRKSWLARRGWKDMDQSKLLTRQRTPPGVPAQIVVTDYIHSEWDLRTQFLMAAICLPIGLGILARLIRALPRRLVSDGVTLQTVEGRQVPFSAITGIDKRKWNRKAIAVVHYSIDGKEATAKIDDWIFKGAADVLDQIENYLGPVEAEAEGDEMSSQEPDTSSMN